MSHTSDRPTRRPTRRGPPGPPTDPFRTRSEPLTPPCRVCKYPMRKDDRVAGVYGCPRCRTSRPPA